MKSNIISFSENLKKILAKKYSNVYSTISEKYIIDILSELERRKYNIANCHDMVDNFLKVKDISNQLSISFFGALPPNCQTITEIDTQTLDRIETRKNNDTV